MLCNSIMLSEVPTGLQTLDKNVIRKYSQHSLYFFLVKIDVYLLLTSCITFVLLYLSGFKVNLSLILSLMRWCCRSLIRLSSQRLVT